jgi:putative flippase GtrA
MAMASIRQPTPFSFFLRLKTSKNTDIVCGVRDLHPDGQTKISGSLSFIRSSISANLNIALLKLFNIQTKDPLTGFFCFRSESVNAIELTRGDGFKILLEILLNNRELKTVDQHISFEPRRFGRSKLDINAVLFFIAQSVSHLTHRLVSERILIFCAIGGFVLGFHTLIFICSQSLFNLPVIWCHFNAVFISSTLSFYLNSKITFSNVPTRFEAKHLAALTFIIVNLVFTFPNIVLFHELLSNFVGIPVFWLSLITIPADTILKFLLVRKIVWKL